jgi:hypothetical protein
MKYGKDLITIPKEEAEHLSLSLSRYGSKKAFALTIHRSNAYVTNFLKPIKVYEPKTKAFIEEYRLPENEYKALLKFIENL